ncbi:MAG TPA: tetratricopeptide repeat protein [Gemmatimonadales bacterium]|nr:tetratricopeptide repeat protein [Gemmatimonadales bacterium]
MLKSAVSGAQDVATLLRTAVQLHQAGRLREAEPLYKEVLAVSPDHPDALHLSGVLAHQAGHHVEALELIDRAIARSPNFTDAHNNRGNVLRVLGRPEEAIAAYRQSITLAPAHALPWSNLGNALRDLGRLDEAIRAYREAINRRPEFAEAHLNLGIVLQEQGKATEALTAFTSATRARPDFAPAHDSLGNALRDAGRLEEAIEAYRRAVALDPAYTTGYCNLGAALWQAGEYREAADVLQAALALDPNRPEAHNHMGNVCKSLGYLNQALSAYRQALALKPDFAVAHFNLGVLLGELDQPAEALTEYKAALGFAPEFADAHSNLGATLMRLDRPAEAITAYRRALELKPDFAGAWYNLGNALSEECRPREAVAAFDRAIAIEPDYAMAHWNRGLAHLTAGDYAKGWEGYEWRWRVADLKLTERSFPFPRWKGEPLAGKTILIHSEQGLGDTLMFARYIPLVMARGGRVVLECQAPLTRLLEAMPSVAQVVAQGDPLPQADYHAPLLSLPALFGTRLGSIPDELPYLPSWTWSNRVPVLPDGKGLKVGIVWGGAAKPTRKRSIPLTQLEPLFGLPGITWYSLQMGEHAAQLMDLPETRRPHNLGPQIRDFFDTAALVGQLDLVISIDTSVAHLAGGLGANLWVMVMSAPDWRWVSGDVESPWYPRARLFRQPRPGDWAAVIEEVRRALIQTVQSSEAV